MLTQERLKEVLKYHKRIGIFTWLIVKSRNVHVGDVAGRDNNGYIEIGVDGKVYFAHRLAFLYMKGYMPENDIDHKDRVRHHNFWKNLRHVSRTCNNRNVGITKANTSGVVGICWATKTAKWQAAIREKGKLLYLGQYKNLLEAAKARHAAEIKYGYPNCNSTSSALQYIKENES